MPASAPPAFRFRARVWLYQGPAAWHFVTLPKKLSAGIKSHFGAMKRGWGSLRVTVSVGKARWKTSIFPDSKAGAYVLPIKAAARAAAGLKAGDTRSFLIEVDV